MATDNKRSAQELRAARAAQQRAEREAIKAQFGDSASRSGRRANAAMMGSARSRGPQYGSGGQMNRPRQQALTTTPAPPTPVRRPFTASTPAAAGAGAISERALAARDDPAVPDSNMYTVPGYSAPTQAKSQTFYSGPARSPVPQNNPYGGSMVDRLRQFRANTYEGPREKGEIMGQLAINPSVQRRALDNALKKYRWEANMYRDGRRAGVAAEALQARLKADPSLQGLDRAQIYQNALNNQLDNQTAQRGQDIRMRETANITNERGTDSFNRYSTLRRGQDNEVVMAREALASNERVAAGQNATELRKAEAGNYYDMAKLSQQQQEQNFEQNNEILDRLSADPTIEGGINTQERNEIQSFITNSGIQTPQEVQFAGSLYKRFAARLREADNLSGSAYPIFTRLFGLGGRNRGKAPTMNQLKGQIEKLGTDENFRRYVKGNSTENEIALLESLAKELSE